MGEAHGFDGYQMGDLEDDIFLNHVANADPTGVISAVSSVYDDGERGLTHTPDAQQTDYEKPQTIPAHRLTDHPPTFIIAGAGDKLNLVTSNVTVHCLYL